MPGFPMFFGFLRDAVSRGKIFLFDGDDFLGQKTASKTAGVVSHWEFYTGLTFRNPWRVRPYDQKT